MSSLKRRAADDFDSAEVISTPTADTTSSGFGSTTRHVAAPPPSHLYVILAWDEYDAGLCTLQEGVLPLGVARTLAGSTELMKTLHDANEAKRVLKDGETAEEFGGLDTNNAKGKIVGEGFVGDLDVRVEKWKITDGKNLAPGIQLTQADDAAFASDASVHYAYTVVHSWSDYSGDFGGHTFGNVILRPSAVPALTCSKLPCKGFARMKFPSADAVDGVLVAQEQDAKRKGKQYLGSARRWIIRDWEGNDSVGNPTRGPARKKAKTA
ncbi:hypothetical protein R3P38DRAFT_2911007 [Favolaschia claudopus]|uniref:Uncharacterized protein n=1 Tax=Favolaschia claudopus TaxID=2862362 RepID=A0AAW0CD02_9AGAR